VKHVWGKQGMIQNIVWKTLWKGDISKTEIDIDERIILKQFVE
jgi:hypothetical protein